MRLIEMAMLGAISSRHNWRHGNTEVRFLSTDRRFASVLLHENHIATVDTCTQPFTVTYSTLAGWDTLTTRSRLRALGVDVPALRRAEGYILPRKRKAPKPRVEDFDI